MDEQALTWLRIRSHPQREVGGEHVHRHAGRIGERDSVGDLHRGFVTGDEVFGERARPRDRRNPVAHGIAGVRPHLDDDSGGLGSEREGQVVLDLGTCRESAQIREGHPGIRNLDEHLSRSRDRTLHLGEFDIVGTGQSGDANGFHSASSLLLGHTRGHPGLGVGDHFTSITSEAVTVITFTA